MNEWALFYLWATVMIVLYMMATHTPASHLYDKRFIQHLKDEAFSMGIRKGFQK